MNASNDWSREKVIPWPYFPSSERNKSPNYLLDITLKSGKVEAYALNYVYTQNRPENAIDMAYDFLEDYETEWIKGEVYIQDEDSRRLVNTINPNDIISS